VCVENKMNLIWGDLAAAMSPTSRNGEASPLGSVFMIWQNGSRIQRFANIINLSASLLIVPRPRYLCGELNLGPARTVLAIKLAYRRQAKAMYGVEKRRLGTAFALQFCSGLALDSLEQVVSLDIARAEEGVINNPVATLTGLMCT